MRATINFEVDIARVNDIMRSLVLEESNALQDAFIALEKATSDRIVEGISDALGHIYGVATQLEQYQQMMVSFEQAKFKTMLPQASDEALLPANAGQMYNSLDELRDNLNNMKSFASFVDNMKAEEEPNDPEEG